MQDQTLAVTLLVFVIALELCPVRIQRCIILNVSVLAVILPTVTQLYTATLDNTSSNNTFCQTIESQHHLRQLPVWSATQNQLL
jgi:hypothetical protein